MIESFIILLREGIEVALVLGILVVYLRSLHRKSLTVYVYFGLALAILASVLGTVLLRKYGLDNEALEGYLLLTAAVFVATMILWMWKKAKVIKQEIHERIDSIVKENISWRIKTGICLFTFLMVVREGIETAVFLQAVALTKDGWQVVIGAFLGISAAIAFGVLFVRGSVRINISRFMKVTAIVLMIFIFQLLANAVHEFYEFGVLPPNPEMMGIVGPIVRHDLLFVLAIVSIPALLLLIPGNGTLTLSQRRFQIASGIAILSVVFFLGFNEVFSRPTDIDLETVHHVELNEGSVHIPLEQVQDGKLHRYVWSDQGVDIRFFVVRIDLSFAAAFDACRACYDYGRYYLLNNELICSKCAAPHAMSFLRPAYVGNEVDENMTGSMEGNGCAPIYLPSRISGGEILISREDLLSQKKYFDYKLK